MMNYGGLNKDGAALTTLLRITRERVTFKFILSARCTIKRTKTNSNVSQYRSFDEPE
jgi:hypothetical protein